MSIRQDLDENALGTLSGKDGWSVVSTPKEIGEVVGAESGLSLLFAVAIVATFREQWLELLCEINLGRRCRIFGCAQCSGGNCGQQRSAKNEAGRLHEP